MSLLMLATLSLRAQHEHKTDTPVDTIKKSIPKEVHSQIAGTHMMLHYYAPAVRGRVIWGGLVPMGEVWVTGAHAATSWEFNNDIVVDGKIIPAGKYAIFTIPGKDRWTFIVNKNWEQHLTDEYDPKDDVARINVKPQKAKHQERLLYEIVAKGTNGELQISWEKVKVVVPFKVTK